MTSLRPHVAEADERAPAWALLAAVFEEPAGWQSRSSDLLYVIREGTDIVGAATVEPGPRSWYIRLLAVDPQRRRRGLGRALLAGIAADASAAGAWALRVKTFRRWSAMQALLAADGWHFIAAQDDTRHDGVAEHWLKPLAARRLQLGVVGANPEGRGGEWIAFCASLAWTQLVGIADTDAAVRERWRAKGIAAYDSAEALLAAHPLDAVIVAVPPMAMRGVQEACLAAGVGMLHEKPLAASLADLLWLQRRLSESPVPLVVGVQRRHHPSYVFLRRCLAAAPHPPAELAIELQLGRKPGQTMSGFRAQRRLAGGGALLDLGYHALDLATWLLDRPLDIIACTCSVGDDLAGPRDLEDRAELTARSGPTWVRLRIDRGGPAKRERVRVRLDDGTWHADRLQVIDPAGSIAFRCAPEWHQAERGCLAELALAIAERAAAPPSPPDLWDHLSILRAIELSSGRAGLLLGGGGDA
ncbi:MAG: Gfo/Idh/MocA family oxidoreductase [Planctomycetota bacterium]|nr:Gfo/Idh/MocA family oxidoreductase [Planctomycetota bacterium]